VLGSRSRAYNLDKASLRARDVRWEVYRTSHLSHNRNPPCRAIETFIQALPPSLKKSTLSRAVTLITKWLWVEEESMKAPVCLHPTFMPNCKTHPPFDSHSTRTHQSLLDLLNRRRIQNKQKRLSLPRGRSYPKDQKPLDIEKGPKAESRSRIWPLNTKTTQNLSRSIHGTS